MDSNTPGQDPPMITNTITKPRPPLPSGKPKPSLPKKPSLAVKPALVPKPKLNTAVNQNGVDSRSNGLDEGKPTTNADDTCTPPTVDQSSPCNSTTPPRQTRPREPPPPLPKVPPSKGIPIVPTQTPKDVTPHLSEISSKDTALPFNHQQLSKHPPSLSPKPVKRPSLSQTPPPLPSTPPRGMVKKSTLSSSRQGSLDSPERQSELDTHGIKSGDTKNNKPCVGSERIKDTVNDKLANSENAVCDKKESESSVAANSEEFKFSNLKSKFKNSTENVSTMSGPKVPLKPKPKFQTKSRSVFHVDDSSVNEDVNKDSVDTEHATGNSKWFISPSETVKESKSEEKLNDGDKPIQIVQDKNGQLNQSSIKFKKVVSPEHSPSNSPKTRRKPPPRVPTKTKPIPNKNVTTENVPEHNVDNKRAKFGAEQSKAVSKDCVECSYDGETKNNAKSDDFTSPDKVNQNDPHAVTPKPVPRKPAPVARPRPTPRKRVSLNRNSGCEETIHSPTSPTSEGLSPRSPGDRLFPETDKLLSENHHGNTDSNQENIKSERDNGPVLTRPKLNDETGKKSNEDEPVLRRPKVLNKTDEKSNDENKEGAEEDQYKVIDRSSVRSQSHITELDIEASKDNEVILRKKVQSDIRFDIQDVPSIEELKSLYHSDEEGEDKNKAEGSTCLSKDFGFSDKFLTFGAEKQSVDNKTEVCKADKINESDDDDDGNLSKSESFEDLLKDKTILEPSSLLNEIEDILTRSCMFKGSSLTRSGSSPEKKMAPYLFDESSRTERSRSVDTEGTPVRPPRPKKELQRMRSKSQTCGYDSCGSDTESLPDLSRGRRGSASSNMSMTLGKAKPHPPKPKRNKLLKVQRSQSDITAMKSLVDRLDTSEGNSPKPRRALNSVSGHESSKDKDSDLIQSPIADGSARRKRPTRKAPPPPVKVTPPPRSSTASLDLVVPLDERVKSISRESQEVSKNNSKLDCDKLPHYHYIKDDEMDSSECGDHDYQDIPEECQDVPSLGTKSEFKAMMQQTHQKLAGKKPSPPKLPPRNMSNSHSFDNSSLSSVGFDVTGVASSNEDVSITSSSGDICSPGFNKKQHFLASPRTSSPFVKDKHHAHTGSEENARGSGLAPSVSSLSSCSDGKSRRPVSECSIQSGSHGQSSSDSELDDEEKICKKKEKKLFMIAQEVVSSERVFVDVLRLLNVDFRRHISMATETAGRPVIPNDVLNRILDYLPQLQNFNEELLTDLEDRLAHWEEKRCLADIFKKKGPFLKLFSQYILNFETITSTLDEALKKYPAFQTAVKEFEMSSRCACLALKHYMLKPIQRIPQYRLLLQDYMNHLPPDCQEMKDMQTALAIVSDVAFHANENMRHEDYVQKMLEIQRSLIGQFEVIKPGRLFLKEGELKKLSRKEPQPRYFFLFNDVLLYTTPTATGYKLNNVLPLAGMKVSVSAQDEYKMEFSVITVQRSFTLQGSSLEEREDWVTALNSAVEENALKRNTFEAVRSQSFESMLDKDFVLGHKAPLWIPDARVTMCMICTIEFTVTFRRHHCRACGWVVCSNCSENKTELRYLKHKPAARVCDKCYKALVLDKKGTKEVEESEKKGDNIDGKEEEPSSGGSTLQAVTSGMSGWFERLGKIRKSDRSNKSKKHQVRPERLKEVSANDEGAILTGYLQMWQKGKKKWKKQWYLVKDKVLFNFKATQDTAAAGSMVLLGYKVNRFTEYFEGVEAALLFELTHDNTDPVIFRTDSATSTERWLTVMREATVA